MKRWSPILALVGCPGPVSQVIPEPPARNGLRIVLELAPSDAILIDRMDLSVQSVVLEAEGPNGPLSISTSTRVQGDLTQGPLSAVLDLESGAYSQVHLSVVLDGDPTLHLWSTWEGRLLELVVSSQVVLEEDLSRLVIAQGPDQEARFVMDPGRWISALDLPELEPEEGPVTISSSQNPDAYEEIVGDIEGIDSDLDDDDDD